MTSTTSARVRVPCATPAPTSSTKGDPSFGPDHLPFDGTDAADCADDSRGRNSSSQRSTITLRWSKVGRTASASFRNVTASLRLAELDLQKATIRSKARTSVLSSSRAAQRASHSAEESPRLRASAARRNWAAIATCLEAPPADFSASTYRPSPAPSSSMRGVTPCPPPDSVTRAVLSLDPSELPRITKAESKSPRMLATKTVYPITRAVRLETGPVWPPARTLEHVLLSGGIASGQRWPPIRCVVVPSVPWGQAGWA